MTSLETDNKGIYKYVERAIVTLTFKIPKLRKEADAQIGKVLADIDEKYGNLPTGMTSYRKIPKVGLSDEQIISELEQYGCLV